MKNEALEKAILKGIELAEKTGTFIIEQAPEVIQQFYRWHTISNWFGIGICVSIILILCLVVRLIGKKEEQDCFDFKFMGRFYNEIIGPIIIVFAAIISLFAISYLIVCIHNLLFIYTAPKLYLIEYYIK